MIYLLIVSIYELSRIISRHWKKFLDEKHNKERHMYEDVVEAMTDEFKCGRCKRENVVIMNYKHVVQTNV